MAARDTIALIKKRDGQEHTPKDTRRPRADNQIVTESEQQHKSNPKSEWWEDITCVETSKSFNGTIQIL